MRPSLPREGNVATAIELERGDPDAAFAAAHIVVEGEYHAPRHHQASIEPRVCMASYEGGGYVFRTSTQAPFGVRDGAAGYLGVRPSDVRVIVPTVGGGFGGKLLPTLEPIAGLLARQAGRPVKLVNTRKEEFLSGCPRENAIIRIRTAVSEDGEILGHESEVLMDNGAYGGEQPVVAGLSPLIVCSNYRTDAIRHTTKLVYTNTPPTGPFRGVLATYAVFAVERHADEIARAIGMDRMEFRRKNLYREGDKAAMGQVLKGVAFENTLDAAEEIAPWKELTASSKPLPRCRDRLCALEHQQRAGRLDRQAERRRYGDAGHGRDRDRLRCDRTGAAADRGCRARYLDRRRSCVGTGHEHRAVRRWCAGRTHDLHGGHGDAEGLGRDARQDPRHRLRSARGRRGRSRVA